MAVRTTGTYAQQLVLATKDHLHLVGHVTQAEYTIRVHTPAEWRAEDFAEPVLVGRSQPRFASASNLGH